jgi:hypothetical protein
MRVSYGMRKTCEESPRNKYFFASLKSLKKGVGSGVGSGSGFVSQRYESAPKCHGSPILQGTNFNLNYCSPRLLVTNVASTRTLKDFFSSPIWIKLVA